MHSKARLERQFPALTWMIGFLLGLFLWTSAAQAERILQERIVFHHFDGENYQVHSIKPDGSDEQQLTSGPGWKIAPRISPDGSHIAYISRTGDSGNYHLLKVMDADGQNHRVVVDVLSLGAPHGLSQIEWDSSSQWLVYSAGFSSQEDRIYIIKADGTENAFAPMEHVNDKDHSPDSSDDGNLIVYIYDSGNFHFNNTLRLYNFTTDTDIQLIGGNGQSNGQPRISPDNRYIAWTQDFGSGGSGNNIYRMNIDGSGVVNLTNGQQGVLNFNPDWSLDGSKIIYVHRPSGSGDELWIMNSDGSDQRMFLANGSQSPDWGNLLVDAPETTPPSLSQTITEIMSDAAIFQEVVLPGASVDLDGLGGHADYSASTRGSFMVWEKDLSTYWRDAPSIEVRFAIDTVGNFYVGAIGNDQEVLSTLAAPTWSIWPQFGFLEPKNHITSLFHILIKEYARLVNAGLVSGELPVVSGGHPDIRGPKLAEWYSIDSRIYNAFPQSVFIVYSAVSVNDPGTDGGMDPWFTQINDRWWPYASGNDDGSAERSFSVQYQNAISSFVVAMAGNDNGNGTSVALDGEVVVSRPGSSGGNQYLESGIRPSRVTLNTNKVWSVATASISIVAVADGIQTSDFSVTPDGGPLSNPAPLILELKPGWNGDGENLITTTSGRIALLNPDHSRVVKAGEIKLDENGDPLYRSRAHSEDWGGYQASGGREKGEYATGHLPDFVQELLVTSGYDVDAFSQDNLPELDQYDLLIVQDPFSTDDFEWHLDNGREPSFLNTFADRAVRDAVQRYFDGGGRLLLVGDAVRLLENEPGDGSAYTLNMGKAVETRQATHNTNQNLPGDLAFPEFRGFVPDVGFFVTGLPFCCADRFASGTLAADASAWSDLTGDALSTVTLSDGQDLFRWVYWESFYIPQDAVSLLDVSVSGQGDFNLNGSTCRPRIFNYEVDDQIEAFMGYTEYRGRKIHYLSSDSFWDYRNVVYQGVWHCGAPSEFGYAVEGAGREALLKLVGAALAEEAVATVPETPADGVIPALLSCPPEVAPEEILEVTLEIDLSGVDDVLGAFDVAVSWDAGLLEFIEIESGAFGSVNTNQNEISQGRITFNSFSQTGAAGEVDLATLRFRAIGEEETSGQVSAEFVEVSATSATIFRDLLAEVEVEVCSFTIAKQGILGDADNNGRVSIRDALIVATFVADHSVQLPEGSDISLGDVDNNGRVSIRDALIIATYVADPQNASLPEGIGRKPVALALEPVEQGDRVRLSVRPGENVRALALELRWNPTELALVGLDREVEALTQEEGTLFLAELAAADLEPLALEFAVLQGGLGLSLGYASEAVRADFSSGTAAWALERLPRVHALLANRPNPFNPETAIDYELPGVEKVVLEIYNLQGQLVRQLVDGMRSGGRHRAVWDGRDARGKRVGSGVYFYRLETPGFVQTRRMALVK